MSQEPLAFWFRRDLRLEDNRGLYEALLTGRPVLPVFIFDRHILDNLPPKDARVQFLHQRLSQLKTQVQSLGSDFLILQGKPEELWPQILQKYQLAGLYTNRDYEPYAKNRDAQIARIFEAKGLIFKSFKDHVIFEGLEITKPDGKPYTVFTPYAKRWRERLDSQVLQDYHTDYLRPHASEDHLERLLRFQAPEMPSMAELGFETLTYAYPPDKVPSKTIRLYAEQRDFPHLQDGTSRLGLHFRFGTISVRQKANKARALSETYLNELIWRDFYAMILANFPQVVNQAFKPAFDRIPWRNAPEDFERWKQGQTGYPLVDAGMRQLNQTGYMHNRVRMVTASFLTKHLLLDWRWGQAYFAEKLLDFDLASNNGGWQWAAGSGTDAAPYFRIFNPDSQQKKFDPQALYIKRWVPEYGSLNYPPPMIDHATARQRCLDTYKKYLNEQNAD